VPWASIEPGWPTLQLYVYQSSPAVGLVDSLGLGGYGSPDAPLQRYHQHARLHRTGVAVGVARSAPPPETGHRTGADGYSRAADKRSSRKLVSNILHSPGPIELATWTADRGYRLIAAYAGSRKLTACCEEDGLHGNMQR
jgi:hypothetical protein